MRDPKEEYELYGVVRLPVMEKLWYFSPFRQTFMDLQHQICLGTGTKFLQRFMEILTAAERRLINRILMKIQVPTIFQRDPRPITENSQYKANEWYTYIVITSVPAYHSAGLHAIDTENPEKNKHKWMRFQLSARFSAIIQFVLSKDYRTEMEEMISEDLLELAKDCQVEFGLPFMRYNFHQIVHHMMDAVYMIGPLDVTSCFVHEGLMGVARRMQHQFFKVQTEVSNTMALRETGDLLEEIVTKPSTSDDIQELRFARRTKLHESAHRLTRNGKKVYLLGKGTDLELFFAKIPEFEKIHLTDAISAQFGDDWKGRVSVQVFDTAISQFDFRIDRRKEISEEKRRADCYVQFFDKQATTVVAILCVKEGANESAFIYGTRMKEKKWSYFDLETVLKRDFYKRFYRLITEEPGERILSDIFNVELPVIVFKDTEEGTVIAPVYLPVPS